jgi:3'-5' exonuclease
MPSSIIVWDIETVPDLRGFAAANALMGRPDDEVQVEMGEKFPKLIYHSIVCIGALVAQRQEEHWTVSALGTPHIGERSEKEIRTCRRSACGRSSSGSANTSPKTEPWLKPSRSYEK